MTEYAYASTDDVAVHIDPDVLALPDEVDFAKENQDVARLIRSYLYVTHVPNTVIDAWLTPETTPELIRSIAGMLVAAKVYGRQTSSNAEEVDPYALRLYNQAMAMLQGVIDGRLVLPELVGAGVVVTGTSHITEDNFYPNDSAELKDQVKFKMGVDY